MSIPISALQELATNCLRRGFDLFAWCSVGAYNARVTAHADFRLPELGSPAHVAVLIGNTRRLWPHFVDALHRDAALRAAPHPLDRFTRAQLEHAVHATAQAIGVDYALRLSADAPPHTVAIQQLAEATGLTQTAPCRLSVHPLHGPWIALRAAVVLAVGAPAETAATAAAEGREGNASARPCDRCTQRPCMPAFERALQAHVGSTASDGQRRVADHYDAWLAVRDACPIGKQARYGPQQLDYHYLKDRRALLRAL